MTVDAILWILLIIALILLAWCIVRSCMAPLTSMREFVGGRSWPDVKIIEKIGHGANGEVFKVEIDGGRFALKREKLLTDKLPEHEMQFYKFIDTLPHDDQKHFIKLLYSRVVKCNHVHTLPDYVKAQRENSDKYKQLSASPWCAEYIMELGGSSLMQSPPRDWRDVNRQVCRIIRLLRSHGYVIGDLHTGNFIMRADDVVLIDYGDIRHLRDGEFGDEYFYTNPDLMNWIYKLCGGDQFFIKYLSKLETFPDRMALINFIRGHAQEWNVVQKYAIMIDPRVKKALDRINAGDAVENVYFDFGFLLMVLYPKLDAIYWSKVVGHAVPPIEPLIPYSDIVFMLYNYHNMDAIIEHFE